MDTAEIQFRTATIGGFQKQDVLTYIETINHGHGEQIEKLQKELEESRQMREELEGRLEIETRKSAELAAQVEKLTDELAATEKDLADVRADLDFRTDYQVELESQLNQIKEKLQRIEPAADAYEMLKDLTAGIELQAHQRAQTVQAEAEEQVRRIKGELDQWIYKVQAGYDRMRTDVDATISHASGELDRVRKTLDTLSAEFADHDCELAELAESYRGNPALPKAPEPIPLEE